MKTTTDLQELLINRAAKQFTMEYTEDVYAFEKAAVKLFGYNMPTEVQSIIQSLHDINFDSPCAIESLQKSFEAQKEYYIYCFMNNFVNNVINMKKD